MTADGVSFSQMGVVQGMPMHMAEAVLYMFEKWPHVWGLCVVGKRLHPWLVQLSVQ